MDDWWVATFPAMPVLTLAFAFNLIGEFDPRCARSVGGRTPPVTHPRAAGESCSTSGTCKSRSGPARQPLPVVRGVSLQVACRRNLRAARRVRVGQEHDGPGDQRPAAGRRPGDRRVGEVQRRGADRHQPQAPVAASRRSSIGMVFQDSLTSLNPIMRIGPQVAEPLLLHGKASARQARRLVGRAAAGHGHAGCRTRPCAAIRTNSPAACASARPSRRR